MHFLVWTGVEEWLTESAAVDLESDGLSANGTQLGAEPAPFRVDYRLEAPDFVTRELELTATAEGWRRHLMLRHDGRGRWNAEVDDEGDVPGGPWDGSLPDLSEALDIDIQNSPADQHDADPAARVSARGLRRLPDGLRHDAHPAGGGLAAALRARPRDRDGSVVSYISRDGDFTAELELDSDGLLRFYPRLARGSARRDGRRERLNGG